MPRWISTDCERLRATTFVSDDSLFFSPGLRRKNATHMVFFFNLESEGENCGNLLLKLCEKLFQDSQIRFCCFTFFSENRVYQGMLQLSILLIGVVLVFLHASFTKPCGLLTLWEWCTDTGDANTQTLATQQHRFAEEIFEAKIKILGCLPKFLIHLTFVFFLVFLLNAVQNPSFASVLELFCSSVSYVCHVLLEIGVMKISTEAELWLLQVLALCLHFAFAISVANQGDINTHVLLERVCTGSMFIVAVVFLDIKITIPVYVCEAAMNTRKHWQLIGLENLTPLIVCASLCYHILFVASFAFIVHILRSNIAARQSSSDASSLLRGFRHILRGVCDGGLVLSRQSCTIVDGASSLECLLESTKTLQETNFLDLFLDVESRKRFLNFLTNESGQPEALPTGLRVSLQGARGPVSLDLFCTQVSPGDLCMLAIKQDPEQAAAPPEAEPNSLPSTRSHRRYSRSQSTTSETVEAYDELVRIALLVSTRTGFLDIEEAHLSFKRQSPELTIETGMPTLRRFINPSDWDRIEGMLDFVTDCGQPAFFRHPMLFRMPGETLKYLRSNETSVCAAMPIDSIDGTGEEAKYFWLHLSDFDSSRRVCLPRGTKLPEIHEE